MTISSVRARLPHVSKIDKRANRAAIRKRFMSHVRNIISLPYIGLSHQKRVIRWELPRLLSSIERLDILMERKKSASLTSQMSGNEVSIRIQEARAREIDVEVKSLVENAGRIKLLLGYKD